LEIFLFLSLEPVVKARATAYRLRILLIPACLPVQWAYSNCNCHKQDSSMTVCVCNICSCFSLSLACTLIMPYGWTTWTQLLLTNCVRIHSEMQNDIAIAVFRPSVFQSVCVRLRYVSKRLNKSLNFFHCHAAPSLESSLVETKLRNKIQTDKIQNFVMLFSSDKTWRTVQPVWRWRNWLL